MNFQSLSGTWQFRPARLAKGGRLSSGWLEATVPGGVHTDLMHAGKIPDPFVEDYELDVQWVAESDWEYRRTFLISSEMMAEQKIRLVCEGLDTLAKIKINGQLVAETNNMFVTYSWEIKDLLKVGENEISIVFESPVKFVTERNSVEPLIGVTQAIPGGPHLRKAPCQFGWDWGPMLPPVGIWKDIRLEGYRTAKIDRVHFRQTHDTDNVSISAEFQLENWSDQRLGALLTIKSPDGTEMTATSDGLDERVVLSAIIENPQYWWPNGYGDQPLYEVSISISADGEKLDERSVRIGLRTLEILQEPDAWGKSFTFIVNGVAIFAKGSNWIPADSFPTRLSDENLRFLIQSAADSNQNMLRVWGGGFYEEERFYDYCDDLGILVWQDMTFSCSIYPLGDEAFVENVYREIVDNVSRLRHRASLALWCGNNEMEMGWESWGWQERAKSYQDAYDRFFHKTLPVWVAELDPDHMYWPSSPSSNTPFENANSEELGDAHYWDVWHGRKPFTAYRGSYPRFMSEFGFQSLPPLETIRTYAKEEDWNMTSYIMEHHQRSGSGNGLMIGQMTDTFRMPKDFPSLVYLSMILQAEGIRYGVEHWRRNKQRVSGTLYWQLNDCWPVASWSSLDYFGRWKALHYAAKKFYAPILLSVEDKGSCMEVHVTSDINRSWSGSLNWKLMHLDGETLESGEVEIEVPALENIKILSNEFELADKQKRETIFVAELHESAATGLLEEPARCVSVFVPNKHLALTKPSLRYTFSKRDQDIFVTLESDRLARFVEVSLDGEDIVFSDNYFDLPAGSEKVVRFVDPAGRTLEELQNATRVRSLYDSFA